MEPHSPNPPPPRPEGGPPPASPPGGAPPLSQMSLDFWLIGGGALLAFIATFLPWYSVSVAFGDAGRISATANGFDVWQGVLAFILAVGVAVGAGLYYFSPGMKAQAQPLAIAFTAAGGLMTLLVFIRMVQGAGGASMSVGLFMSLIGGIAILAGGIMLLMALQRARPM